MPNNNQSYIKRIATYDDISKKLALYSDEESLTLIENAEHIGTSMGGTSYPAGLKIPYINFCIA